MTGTCNDVVSATSVNAFQHTTGYERFVQSQINQTKTKTKKSICYVDKSAKANRLFK